MDSRIDIAAKRRSGELFALTARIALIAFSRVDGRTKRARALRRWERAPTRDSASFLTLKSRLTLQRHIEWLGTALAHTEAEALTRKIG